MSFYRFGSDFSEKSKKYFLRDTRVSGYIAIIRIVKEKQVWLRGREAFRKSVLQVIKALEIAFDHSQGCLDLLRASILNQVLPFKGEGIGRA